MLPPVRRPVEKQDAEAELCIPAADQFGGRSYVAVERLALHWRAEQPDVAADCLWANPAQQEPWARLALGATSSPAARLLAAEQPRAVV